jgi:FkbM family methyltransferase
MVLLRNEYELEIHPTNEGVSNRIRQDQDFYEHEILDYMAENYDYLRNIIIDVGANIGNHTVFFYEYFIACKIIAIEPVVRNFEVLQRNVAGREITRYFGAASDKLGTVKMVINESNMGTSRVSDEGECPVPCFPLDSLWFDEPISLIKIDVEYHEPQVLAGAKGIIDRYHPLILIEDWDAEYKKLLPGYREVKFWEKYRTYLYEWAG